MADFLSIGNKLFVMMLIINFFFMAFGGYERQPFLLDFVPDQVISSQSITGSQVTIIGDPTSTSASSDTIFDFAVETVGAFLPGLLNLLDGILFSFVNIALLLHFPNEIMISVIYPLSLFMLFYTVIFVANLANLIFRGGGGGQI